MSVAYLKKISESKIQSKIINKLEAEGYLVLKLIKTNCNGIPDLIALKENKTMFIEVKQPSGKLSEIQKYRIAELKAKGIEVHVWTDYKIDYDKN